MGKHLSHSHLSQGLHMIPPLDWFATCSMCEVDILLNTFPFLSFISSPVSPLLLHCSFNHCCLLFCRPTLPSNESLSTSPSNPPRLIPKPTDLLFGWLCVRTTSRLCASLCRWMWVMPTDMSCCHRDDSLSITVRNITASLPKRQCAEGWPRSHHRSCCCSLASFTSFHIGFLLCFT